MASWSLLASEFATFYESAGRVLIAGAVGQRQRANALADRFAGVAEARAQLDNLDFLIADEPITQSQEQADLQRILHCLPLPDTGESAAGVPGGRAGGPGPAPGRDPRGGR